MTTPDEPTPLASLGARYFLIEQLGADSHHDTWRGHDDLAGRQIIATRYLDVDDTWRPAFERRARQLQALSDPGIASVLAHDAVDDPPWLVTSYVDGTTVADLVTDPGVTTDDALAVIGQTAFALAAAHGARVGHGRLDTEHVQVRPDGSIALIGFVVDDAPTTSADLVALGRLAHQLLDEGTVSRDVTDFVRLLDAGDWDDPADIGRTALALAAAQRVGQAPPVSPPKADPDDDNASAARRPWYDEDERKRVRNRLIALGVIVVLGGAALLRIFSAGSGETSVPSVIGEPYVEAQHDLNEVGLRGNETVTTGPAGTEGTVIVQEPTAGQRAKVGSVVQLTVVAIGPS